MDGQSNPWSSEGTGGDIGLPTFSQRLNTHLTRAFGEFRQQLHKDLIGIKTRCQQTIERTNSELEGRLRIFDERINTFRDEAVADTYANFEQVGQLPIRQKEEYRTLITTLRSEMEKLACIVETLRLDRVDQSGTTSSIEAIRLELGDKIEV